MPDEDKQYNKQNVRDILDKLTAREAKAVRMRLGIEYFTDSTLEEVARQCDVTRERIRRIEAKALQKLRNIKSNKTNPAIVEKPTGELPNYLETIRHQAVGAGKTVDKQRQCSVHVELLLKPVQIHNKYASDSGAIAEKIPQAYLQAMLRGTRAALAHGPLAGLQVIGTQVVFVDVIYQQDDDTDIKTFYEAGRLACADALRKAGPVMLEAIYELEILVDKKNSEKLADAISIRRGVILEQQARDTSLQLRVELPRVELAGFRQKLMQIEQHVMRLQKKFKKYQEVHDPGPHGSEPFSMALFQHAKNR